VTAVRGVAAAVAAPRGAAHDGPRYAGHHGRRIGREIVRLLPAVRGEIRSVVTRCEPDRPLEAPTSPRVSP